MANWIGVSSQRFSAARPARKARMRREEPSAPQIVVVDDLVHEAPFSIGDLVVRPATCEVIVGDRRETLEPRLMQVLVVLAHSVGEVVSRHDLIRTCWAGRMVSDQVIDRAVAGVRRAGRRLGGYKVARVGRVGFRLEVADPGRLSARLKAALISLWRTRAAAPRRRSGGGGRRR